MISGQARKGLVGMGHDFEGAIPSVITGSGHINPSRFPRAPSWPSHSRRSTDPLMVEVCFS
jgi:chemotaxis protein CheX